jgi:hypothetical protein
VTVKDAWLYVWNMKWFPTDNPVPAKRALALIIFGFIAFFAINYARAAEVEIMGGGAAIRASTSWMGMKVIAPDIAGEGGDVGCGFRIIGASIYHDTWAAPQVVVDCQVFARMEDRVKIGVGIARLQHADPFNCLAPGGINFSLSAQGRVWEQLWIGWFHQSSAGSCEPNLGRDLIGVSWVFGKPKR